MVQIYRFQNGRERGIDMVYIKANNEIIKVYQSVITSKKERVEWNGDIVIRKNAMILVGRLRSMYFELSSRRVYSDIE